MPNSCILRLQRIQNSAARIIYRRKKFDHVSPLLKQLHWLPIRQRIQYKLLLLCFKAQHGLAPSYFQDCIIPYSPCRPLRTKHLLVVPPTKLKTYGDRSFNKAAPFLWNKLPYHLQSCNKLDQFKRHLKSHLFNIAYLQRCYDFFTLPSWSCLLTFLFVAPKINLRLDMAPYKCILLLLLSSHLII